MGLVRLLFALLVMLSSACAVDAGEDAGVDYGAPGPHAVGVRSFTVTADGGRALTVEVWYPAGESARAASEEGFEVTQFEADPTRAALLAEWLEQTPDVCAPRRAAGARDVPIKDSQRWPLLVFSHCTECFRYSMHSVTAHLASHGFVVAAPDHTDNTRFDATAPLTDAFLAVRVADVSRVIDEMLPQVDAERVAVFGHSFGAVTAGKTVELDERARAGFLIAAPAKSPFLNFRGLENLDRPLSFLLAREDNSITQYGNDFIRENFIAVPKPNWLIEVDNAGHWSFSDIAGLGERYLPGCGEGVRELDGGAFTYIDNDEARHIAKRAVTAWASYVLRGDEAAATALGEALPDTEVKSR